MMAMNPSNLKSAIDKLLTEAHDAESTEPIRAAAKAVLALAPGASVTDRDEAVTRLSAALDPDHVQRSGWLAITAGAMVESGGAVAPLADRLIAHLPAVVRKATEFGERSLAFALSPEASEELDDDADGQWVGEQYLTPEKFAEAASEWPDTADAWSGLANWIAPAIACFSRDASLRRLAAADLPAVKRLVELNDGVKCLSILLSVLDDEQLIVIEPASRLGFRVRVSGVADNYQLHTLLGDILVQAPRSRFVAWLSGAPRRLKGQRPHPAAAAIARGEGPHSSDLPSKGLWDLYDWRAVDPDGTLPAKVPAAYWIWNEGIPADIPRFERHRVVLLAPPSYERNWNTGRFFSQLRADVVLEEVLAESAVDELLALMGSKRALETR